jgi:hypothetical protein
LGLIGNGPAYFQYFLPGLALFGIGMALVIAPLTKSGLMVPSKFSGSASGVNNAVGCFAALMTIAALGVIMVAIFSTQLQNTIRTSILSSQEQVQIADQSKELTLWAYAERPIPPRKALSRRQSKGNGKIPCRPNI